MLEDWQVFRLREITLKAKMKIKYRKAWLSIVGVVLLLALLTVMAVIFILKKYNLGWVILVAVFAVVILVAAYFRFNYGITINENRLIAIEQARIKVLRYDDISSIVVKFTNKSVAAYIKMKNQKEYIFMWEEIVLGNNPFFAFANINKIKINDEFIKKSIASLSKCEKVKIQNFYIQQ